MISDAVEVALITSVPSTITAVAALIISWHSRGAIAEVKGDLTETKHDFDGKMDKYIAAKDQVADLRADAGYQAGKEDQRKISGTEGNQ